MTAHASTLDATKLRILAYLQRHPAAADSARGIQRWWLAESEVALSTVEAAAEALAREGKVTKTRLTDGNAVFSARPVQRDDE